jgi:hypothetical protein
MATRLLQHRSADGTRRVILATGDTAVFLESPATVRELAQAAIAAGQSLAQAAAARAGSQSVDIAAELAAGTLLPAIDHSDTARVWLTGTGLTHLGSAEGRDKMHRDAAQAEKQTDSMRMFLEGLEGGKPAPAPKDSSRNGSTRAMAPSLLAPASR